jgi:phosphate ABC transporter permease protein PstC
LAEISPKWAKNIVRPAIELLAGIPSILYGLFALVVIVDLIKVTFDLATGESVLAGSIILAIMILPMIISVSQDAIESVPKAFKEGSYAMGTTDWQTISKIIIPTAMPGIVASIILGMGRAIGETMAVVLVLGNVERVPTGLLQTGEALTSAILLEMGEAVVGSSHYSALFAVGMILFTIVLILSLISNQLTARRTLVQR